MYHSRLTPALAIAALAAILVPSTLTAQITFQRTYGGVYDDEGLSVQQTTDGGYIIAACTNGLGTGPDVYVIRTNSGGDTMWTRAFGGTDEDYGSCVQQTSDGGYVISGYTMSFGAGNFDLYLVKTDAHGDTQWTRTYGGTETDEGLSVQQTTDGGYVIAGYTLSSGAGDADIYLVKTDTSGDTIWTRTYGGASQDYGFSVQQTVDNGYIVTGYTESFGAGSRDVYLVKTNAQGDTQWTRTCGGSDDDEGYSVRQTADTGFIIAGVTYSWAGSYDVYLIKTNANGDTLWTRTFGGTAEDYGYSVRQTSDSGFVITGYTHSFGAGEADAYLIKTNSDGDTQWARTYGGASHDHGYSVQQTADGGYAVAGNTYSFGAGNFDVYLIKTDSLGTLAVAESKASSLRAPALSLACTPNPASGSVTISLSPSTSLSLSPVLHVYDAQGRRVRTLTVNREPYTVWNGTDELGQTLPSGTYFIVLNAGGQHATSRIMLQR